MTSKAERKRRKRKTITLPMGEVAPCPPRQGRRTDILPDAMNETLQVRARMADCELSDAKSPLAGCDVGRKLLPLASDLRSDLWQAVCHMRRVWVAYDRAIGAPSRHAQCLRILAPADTMTTEGSIFDDRPQAERDRAAVSAYMTLQGWLDYVDRPARSAAIIAIIDDAGVTNWPGIMRVLHCVSEGVKGQRVTPRFAPA